MIDTPNTKYENRMVKTYHQIVQEEQVMIDLWWTWIIYIFTMSDCHEVCDFIVSYYAIPVTWVESGHVVLPGVCY